MPRRTDEQVMAEFLETLTERGGSAGNYSMMNDLNLSEDEYWRIRNKLLDAGSITLGGGRGGSVILVAQHIEEDESEVPDAPSPTTVGTEDSNTTTNDGVVAAETYPDEASLYQACYGVLESQWGSLHRLFGFKAQVTARQGSRRTGGIWTRPDIAAVSVRSFPYWPGRHFDLWTFEIKPLWAFNVIGLFEALAHARCATQSWALYHVNDEIVRDGDGDDIDRMASEALRLGVGLIVFTDPADFSTWDIKAYSRRTTPDPFLHDEFVKQQLSEETRELLLQWAR